MKLKKCQVCGNYTLKQEHCEKETKQSGYKFIKPKTISSAAQLPQSSHTHHHTQV